MTLNTEHQGIQTWRLLAATLTDLKIIILSAARQGKTSYDITSAESKKLYKWTYLQNRNRLRLSKQIYDYQRGKREQNILGIWD